MSGNLQPDADMPPAKRVRSSAVESVLATTQPAIGNAATGDELAKIVADAMKKIRLDDPSIVYFYAELIQAVAAKQKHSFDLLPSLDLLLRNPPQSDKNSRNIQAEEGKGANFMSLYPLMTVIKARRELYFRSKNAQDVYTLLHKAAEWLLEADNCVGKDDAVDFDLLCMARYNLELTKMLLAHGAKPNPKPEGKGLLIQAMARGDNTDMDVLKLLAPHYCSKTELGAALLSSCEECYMCHSQTVRTLVKDCDANVHYVRPSDGATSLLLAASHRYQGCVATLIEGGAKPVPNYKGVTPLMRAAEAYHEDDLEVELLLQAGDKINARGEEGCTALGCVGRIGSVSDGPLFRALIQGGAHGNSTPGCGLLQRTFEYMEGDDDFEDEDEEEKDSHRMHVLLLRATLPVFDLHSEEHELLQELEENLGHVMASTCLAVHQAHFRHARAVFVAARSCIQLVRAKFSGVDSPIARALVAAHGSS